MQTTALNLVSQVRGTRPRIVELGGAARWAVRDRGSVQDCAPAKPMTPILHRSVTVRHIRNEMVIHALALKSAA